jgi:bacterioferritin-associated ferredoxin
MIVCSCNVVTDSEIRAALVGGACPRTPFAVYERLGCSLNCGRCIATVRTIINEANAGTETGGSSPEVCEMDAIVLCPV